MTEVKVELDLEKVKSDLESIKMQLASLTLRSDEELGDINLSLCELKKAVDKKANISEELKSLIEVNGRDAVVTAFKTCVGSTKLKETAGYAKFISPEKVEAAMSNITYALDKFNEDLVGYNEANLKVAGIRGKLLIAESDIKATEAEAILSAPALKNKEDRDAYRRNASDELRKQRAMLEMELQLAESNLNKARYFMESKRSQIDISRSTVDLLASIFKFLS